MDVEIGRGTLLHSVTGTTVHCWRAIVVHVGRLTVRHTLRGTDLHCGTVMAWHTLLVSRTGMVRHFSAGTTSHFWLGMLRQTLLVAGLHFCCGTVRHCFVGTLLQCCLQERDIYLQIQISNCCI
jgi:hypothetical protein